MEDSNKQYFRGEINKTGQSSSVGLMHTILRLPDVKKSTGLSRSTIYLRISQGTFPKPVSLGGRAVGWLEAEVQQRQIEASRCQSGRGAGGNFWGHDPIFKLRISRLDEYLQ